MTDFPFLSYDLALAGVIFALTLAALLLLKIFFVRQFIRLASHNRLEFLNYPEQILKSTSLLFMIGVALLAGLHQLELSARQERWVEYAWIVILVSQIAIWANRAVTVAVNRAFERHRQTDPSGATHLMLAGLIARILLWSIAGLAILDNLGFNITTLMASLGIGGIAVALAAQNILGDLFSSLSIALDKPFVIGDFIVVDSYMGTVEYVGLKTTRIRSLGGEQIVFSNSELLKTRIRNYKLMQERRVQFEFGIAHETSLDNIERLPGIIKEIITSEVHLTRFDRAHFKGYGESALNFEVVYYVLDADFNVYMDIQQAINLALLRRFRQYDIALATPVRRVQVSNTADGQVSSFVESAPPSARRVTADGIQNGPAIPADAAR